MQCRYCACWDGRDVGYEVSESEDDTEDDDRSSDSGEDSDEGRLGLLDGENEDTSDVGSAQDEEENDGKPVKPQLPHPEAGATLSRFRAYGPLRYARITLDPAYQPIKGC